MSDKPKKSEPLIGYVVIEGYTEDMSDWSGAIAYPNPEGANLFWEKPEPFIQKSAFDALKLENEKLKKQINEMIQGHESSCYACMEAHIWYEKMKLENEELRRALEFYADKDNWRTNSGKIGVTPLTDGSDAEMIDGHFTNGKLARAALKNGGGK